MSVFEFDLKPGEWYIFITCHNCQQTQVLFPDLTQRKSKLKAIYVWACPTCNYRGKYDSDQLVRRQGPIEGCGFTRGLIARDPRRSKPAQRPRGELSQRSKH